MLDSGKSVNKIEDTGMSLKFCSFFFFLTIICTKGKSEDKAI